MTIKRESKMIYHLMTKKIKSMKVINLIVKMKRNQRKRSSKGERIGTLPRVWASTISRKLKMMASLL